jgi:prepilin-type N-terminal cleavage/methylation domain-containing protein
MSLRDEKGFTIPELLIAMILFAIILLATLGVFDRYYFNSSVTTKQSDSVEEARTTVDQVTRQLRNLANPIVAGVSTINTAEPYNLIFQTNDPTKTWVRYCEAPGSGSNARGTLYYATSASVTLTAAQTAASCPTPAQTGGWASVKVLASDVTNQTNGQDRPMFNYTCVTGAPAGCPAGSADYSKIVFSRATLYIDVNPGKAPGERLVTSGVYLRNQNEAPVASFAETGGTQGTRTVTLNASASYDPEGRTLHYYWYKGSGTRPTALGDPCLPAVSGTATFIGTGVTLTYSFPKTDASPMPIQLVVKDPGCLADTTTGPSSPYPIP